MTKEDELKIKSALREGGPQLAGKFVKEKWVEEFTLTGNLESIREELFDSMRQVLMSTNYLSTNCNPLKKILNGLLPS